MSGISVCGALHHWGGGHAGIHFIYSHVALCMAATSVCSLLQNWDASHDAGIISCPSCSLKQLLYFTLCICQQRVFQVFFDIYLIFNIVHMTASCLLPAYATYRNAQLMDSLLSYFSSKRHAVFSEPAIPVLCCHGTFFSRPDFHFNGSTLTWITWRGAAPPPPPHQLQQPARNQSSCHHSANETSFYYFVSVSIA